MCCLHLWSHCLVQVVSWLKVVIFPCNFDAELKTLLKAKEDFITDLTLDVYRYTDAHQNLEKKLKDADHQMVDSMKRIKALSAELQDFKDAAKLVVDMVDPVTGEAEGEKTLL